MNKLFVSIFLLFIGLFVTFSDSAFATSEEGVDFFDSYWTKSDENLYLHIILEDGLKFDDEYYTMGPKACQVTFRPMDGHEKFSPQGRRMLKTDLSVQIKKNLKGNNFEYTVYAESLCEDVLEKDSLYTYCQEIEGKINVSLYDIWETPRFLTNDEGTKGIVVFPGVFLIK